MIGKHWCARNVAIDGPGSRFATSHARHNASTAAAASGCSGHPGHHAFFASGSCVNHCDRICSYHSCQSAKTGAMGSPLSSTPDTGGTRTTGVVMWLTPRLALDLPEVV